MWPVAAGQLVRQGLRSDFEFGQQLKSKYLDSGLVASNAIDARESALMVYSSRSDRALQSAQALLRGMFGVRDELQTVPVHGAVRDMLDGWRACPSGQEMTASLRTDADWAKRKTERLYQRTRDRLSKDFGLSVTLENWERLYDWIQSANSSGFGLTALPKGFSQQLQRDVTEIGEWVITLPFLHQSTVLFSDLTGGGILNDVLQKIDDLQANKPKASRMVIYSAHAANIMGLLRILRMDKALQRPPSFGDGLFIELAETDDKKLVVLVRYHNQVWSIPDCPNRGPCLLTSFRAMFQTYANASFVDHYWPSLCDRDLTALCPSTEPLPSPISFVPLWVVAGILFGILGAVLLALIAWKWYRNRTYRKRSEILLDLEISS